MASALPPTFPVGAHDGNNAGPWRLALGTLYILRTCSELIFLWLLRGEALAEPLAVELHSWVTLASRRGRWRRLSVAISSGWEGT